MKGLRFSLRDVGMADVIGNKLIVMPVKGAYIPRIDDIVLGRVTDIGMSGWQVDIYAPYPAMLPASETPMHAGEIQSVVISVASTASENL